jgi:hypothetical protein
MERNTALFEKIAAAIEEQPHLYNQRFWGLDPEDAEEELCDTAHCVAGWAVWLEDGVHCDDLGYVPAGPTDIHVRDRAIELLGITYEESSALFEESWKSGESIEDVAQALRDIGRGAPIYEFGPSY